MMLQYKYDVTEGITNLPEGAYAEVTVDKDNKEVIKIYDNAKRLSIVHPCCLISPISSLYPTIPWPVLHYPLFHNIVQY